MSAHLIDPMLRFSPTSGPGSGSAVTSFPERLHPEDAIRIAGSAIRGLAFGLLVQGIVTGVVVLAWEIIRHLR